MFSESKNGILCMHLPKVASQSFKQALSVINFEYSNEFHFIRELDPKKLDNYNFIFSFVRDPLDRLISSWRQSNFWKNFDQYIDFLNTIDFSDYNLIQDAYKKIRQNIENYVIVHSIPQSFYFEINKKIYNKIFIGKFENLQSDYFEISERIKKIENLETPPLLHKNKSKFPDLEPCISIRSKILISKIYHMDYENFGYDIKKGA